MKRRQHIVRITVVELCNNNSIDLHFFQCINVCQVRGFLEPGKRQCMKTKFDPYIVNYWGYRGFNVSVVHGTVIHVRVIFTRFCLSDCLTKKKDYAVL